MALTSAFRTPYRSRTLVSSGVTRPVDEAKLGRAIVLTRLVLLALCAARAGADLRGGSLTIEGGVALVLAIAFAMSLVAKAIVGVIRVAIPAERRPASLL
jgi:hypothetical protein